jgi:hypothetical protein
MLASCGVGVVIVANLYSGLAGPLALANLSPIHCRRKLNAPVGEQLKALDGLAIAVPTATSAVLARFRMSAPR